MSTQHAGSTAADVVAYPFVDLEADATAPPPLPRMTEDEFAAWCDEDTRAEWVDGEVIVMSPSNYKHVSEAAWLLQVLGFYVDHHDLGVVVGPEFPVRLAGQRRRRVPDLLFVANSRLHLVHENHFEGPPDLVVEIVSPDSLARDWREKYLEYQAAGVREYWVIDPMSQHAEMYALGDDGAYQRIDKPDGTVASVVLPGLVLKLAWLWPSSRPKLAAALAELGVLSPPGS
jgi:Uma2 family endonuclease